MTIQEKMIRHIHSINIALTIEWLNMQTNELLLANCHPIDRERYTLDLKFKIKEL